MTTTLHADVLILGGGIAGLWTLARLRSLGFACVLVESAALGAGQTIASQGIIHGGLKYALDGQVGSAASAIAAMPEVWRACLRGDAGAPVDLRGVPVLSDHYYYWTSPGVMSRLAGAGASKVMRTAVERVPAAERPAALRDAPTGMNGVDVYRVGELVLDARALVARLAEIGRGCIVHGEPAPSVEPWRGGSPLRMRCHDGRGVEIRASAVVLAAGAGNEGLLTRFILNAADALPVRTQRRPLHMVMLRCAPGAFFGHCVGTSSSPRLTITSGVPADTGESVWYIGGQVAESGVARAPREQIAATRRELTECMPWLNLPDATRWATLRIDRAEGVPPSSGLLPGLRPELPVVARSGRVLAAWPTKLAFAPLLADEVARELEAAGVSPRADGALNPALPAPPVAAHVWDREGVEWS
ncbi:MAG: FAD-dependent oxidoreductase [Phycisphaeraceae bacterium]|nr:FAD-dependent oxidoreductase [Phycisphaeraceae bacterium]